MADLVEFLRARLEEEERVALEADARVWTIGPDGAVLQVDPPEAAGPGVSVVATVTLTIHPGWADEDGLQHGRQRHIACWSPARVLAEVAAKRAILDAYAALIEDPSDAAGSSPNLWHHGGRQDQLADAILELAQPYADHPDFDPAWRAADTAVP